MADDSEESELRRAVQHAVIQVCGAEEENGSTMTATAVKALAELTYLYATTSLASDLDAFSTHANRKTITVDDVRLAIRKNQSLLKKLEGFAEGLEQNCNKVGPRKSILKENKSAHNIYAQASSDDESDLGATSIRKTSKPAGVSILSKKRDRPVALASKRMQVQSDSSTDDSDAVSKQVVTRRKRTAAETIHLDDNSTSSEEELEPKVTTKKSGSHLTRALTSLSFSDEEE